MRENNVITANVPKFGKENIAVIYLPPSSVDNFHNYLIDVLEQLSEERTILADLYILYIHRLFT